jgi:hypothetical protein
VELEICKFILNVSFPVSDLVDDQKFKRILLLYLFLSLKILEKLSSHGSIPAVLNMVLLIPFIETFQVEI